MDIQIVAATTSIANCLQIVKDLRNDGIAKEDLLVITNLTTREIIFNNHNLRQSDGSVFSSHSLLQNVKHILILSDLEKEGPIPDALVPYKERIEFGSMIIAVLNK